MSCNFTLEHSIKKTIIQMVTIKRAFINKLSQCYYGSVHPYNGACLYSIGLTRVGKKKIYSKKYWRHFGLTGDW